MELIESGVGDVWQVKQAALGTIEPSNAANTKHLRKNSDDGLKAAKTYGSEEWTDGKQFGSPSIFVDTVGGSVGTLTSEAQPENAGFHFAQIIGADVVTGTTPDYTHTIASGTANGPYQTFRQKVGVNVGPFRNAFWDAKTGKLTFNAGQDQKVAHIAQDIWALHAGDWFTADPTAVDSGSDAWNWNECDGATTIDGTPFTEIDGDTVEIDRKLDVHRGNGPKPVAFVPGKGEMNRTMSGVVTDATLPLIKQTLYGTATPADGAAVTSVVKTVALETTYTRTAARSLKITTPKVVVKPDDFAIYARTTGGKIPVAFGGQCLDNGATPMITVVAKTGDAGTYV